MMAMKRMSMLAGQLSPSARAFGYNIQQYMEESEKVRPPLPASRCRARLTTGAGGHRRGPRGRALRVRARPADAARVAQGAARDQDGADVRPAGVMIARSSAMASPVPAVIDRAEGVVRGAGKAGKDSVSRNLMYKYFGLRMGLVYLTNLDDNRCIFFPG